MLALSPIGGVPFAGGPLYGGPITGVYATGEVGTLSTRVISVTLSGVYATGQVGSFLVWEPVPTGPSGNWVPVVT